ncbi:MAG: J domain-containing protein [Sphingomonadaceae bacterium]
MLLLALLAGAVLGWLWWNDRYRPLLRRWLLPAALGLVATWLAARGQWAGALLVGAGAPLLARLRPRQSKVRAVAIDETEARRILGVGPDASQEEIRTAYRRIISHVHPDKGGSAELAHRVNQARDRLLDPDNR